MGHGARGGALKFILDSHVLLYWGHRDRRLTAEQRKVLDAASETNPLGVSDITLWEISALEELGRIRLHIPLRDWLEAAVAPPLVRRIPITPAIAVEAGNLPDSLNRDPADRIIVATARVLGATLLTQDPSIIESGVVRTV